jgi:hypothetical protein
MLCLLKKPRWLAGVKAAGFCLFFQKEDARNLAKILRIT